MASSFKVLLIKSCVTFQIVMFSVMVSLIILKTFITSTGMFIESGRHAGNSTYSRPEMNNHKIQ